MSDGSSRRLEVPPHVVIRDFPTETVVLNIQTGQYHGLDPVAGRMLRAVTSAGSVEAALEDLLREFEGVARPRLSEDLERFCAQLLERGLLELRP